MRTERPTRGRTTEAAREDVRSGRVAVAHQAFVNVSLSFTPQGHPRHEKACVLAEPRLRQFLHFFTHPKATHQYINPGVFIH